MPSLLATTAANKALTLAKEVLEQDTADISTDVSGNPQMARKLAEAIVQLAEAILKV